MSAAAPKTGRIVMAVLLVAAVGVAVWAMFIRSNWEPAPIRGVEGAADSRLLRVSVGHNECGTGDPRVDAEEGETVVLSAEFDRGRGSCDDISLTTTVDVELERPVGNRTIEARTRSGEFECEITGGNPDVCVRLPLAP